jgi:hypothetical protein
MNEAPQPDRFPFCLWTLAGVAAVGLWVPGRVLPAVVGAIVVVEFVRSLVRARRVLPERVASHFNFALVADGWMSRKWYLVLMAGMTVVVGGLVPLGLFVLAMLRGEVKIQRLALWVACLLLSLLWGTNELMVRANLREPAELPQTFWALVGLFILAINLWALALLFPW